MSDLADQLVDQATAHVQEATSQADPHAEFHLRHAEVLAAVAMARYLRTVVDTLGDVAARIQAGAETVRGTTPR